MYYKCEINLRCYWCEIVKKLIKIPILRWFGQIRVWIKDFKFHMIVGVEYFENELCYKWN